MTEELSDIVGKKVEQFFLIVWPPAGEDNVSQIDICAGFLFSDLDEIFIITTDKNDLSTPHVFYRKIPNIFFESSDFEKRIKCWMEDENFSNLDEEWFNQKDNENFFEIVGQTIRDVELVEMSPQNPIGIKVVFENDYVLSSPTNDGNTVETASFNKHENLRNFESLGHISYRSVK